MPLFGAPQGVSQAIGDVQGLENLALYPDQARLLHAQAGLETMRLQEEQNYAKALAAMQTQHRPPTPVAGTPALPGDTQTGMLDQQIDNIGRLAEVAAGAGAPNKAMGLLKTYEGLISHKATIEAAQARQQFYHLKTAQEQTQWFATHAMDVKDPQSFDKLNNDFEAQFNTPSPYRGMQWSADLPDRIAKEALSVKDRITISMRDAESKAREADRADAQRSRRVREGIAQQRLKLEQEREGRQQKLGKTADPTPGTIEEAKRLILKDYPNIDDKDGAAYNVASEAKAIMRKNPSLGASEAVAQAYLAAKSRGEFVEGQPFTIGGFKVPGTTPQTKFVRPELQRESAQMDLAKKYGVQYDPTYEYREVAGQLQRRKKD